MSERKQRLLKQHRRTKRLSLLLALGVFLVLGAVVGWWLIPPLLLLGWVAHEAWFSDHLFYSPGDDYQYVFPDGTAQYPAVIRAGRLAVEGEVQPADTLILEVRLRGTWLGRWLDPFVRVGDDRQDFERGVRGRRYLNLSGLGAALAQGELTLAGRFCTLAETARLYAFANPDYSQRRLMVIAPHADDAELAAFGLYRAANDVSIVTLTQGEIEADKLHRLGLAPAAAARLKGRLRSWNSLAVPLWGGVAQARCAQLGYYCLQLRDMAARPSEPFGSREADENDIRTVRGHNPLRLPGDTDGRPTWNNLVADLVALLEHFRPEVVVTPHPELDPHSDHVAATQALHQAIAASAWKPELALLYANHLSDNDRWPMGPAGFGVALPPAIQTLPADALWSPALSPERQLDKAMALTMQYDLQGRLPAKQRLRRLIQRLLVGRRWPATGEDDFFRKAVRRHEVFWVRPLAGESAAPDATH